MFNQKTLHLSQGKKQGQTNLIADIPELGEEKNKEDTNLSDFVEKILGANKKNRLESILSEAIIFGMNTGQWKHATLAQIAYEHIAGINALGPLVSSTYVALGYKKLDSALDNLKSMENKVDTQHIWGLRAFIGMFMIFNDEKEEAEQRLADVANSGDPASQKMASQLLHQFFNQQPRFVSKARVPGLPL